MAQRILPIGIQTFRKIREDGCHYVDKTPWIERLVNGGSHYFLSRPRRFGKSLFLDTIKELFEGSESLFEGLAIHDRWDWSVRYPVVRLSFGGGTHNSPGSLERDAGAQLDRIGKEAEVDPRGVDVSGRFRDLLYELHAKTTQRVVVLVDEYDKPIVDALDRPDVARANRDFLRGLYATIKDADADVRFCFLTGVSRFSKVSLFSGLNNLIDITLKPEYSSVCGYTEADLDRVFAEELRDLDRERVREWYNGYSWLGDEKVYNPFDVLLLLFHRRFNAWWFETGSPTFLVDTLLERAISPLALDGMVSGEELLGTFDIDRIEPEALLFQTGYLTIVGKETRADDTRYRLGYPNREVFKSLNRHLLRNLTRDRRSEDHLFRLYDMLADGDIDGLRGLFHALFAGIPYEWHTGNPIARFEGYYASVFYACLAATPGTSMTVEDSTSRGRADLTVRIAGRVYIFEFKVVDQAGEGSAMAQLRDRAYADKYRSLGEPIHLVAVEFNGQTRNLVAFEAERA